MSAWDETARMRAEVMRVGLDVHALSGLEIGPLANPIVGRAEGAIRYVDHTDAASLRATYAWNPEIRPEAIVEIDAVWGDRTLAECVGGERVDYVMASHVAEHVPDLVTWLAEVAGVLKPDGQLRVVMPDMRFSHDALRPETTVTDLLAAYVVRARRPQVRDVLDFRLQTASGVDGLGIYEGRSSLDAVRPDHSVEVAIQSAEWARDNPGVYFDVHCWVFRALGFARLMQRLAELGLLRMACVRMIDTAPPLFEFYAFLTPCEDPAEAAASWARAAGGLHDPLPGSAAARRAAEAASALAEAQARAARAEAELARLRASRSWRLTAPLRRMRARL